MYSLYVGRDKLVMVNEKGDRNSFEYEVHRVNEFDHILRYSLLPNKTLTEAEIKFDKDNRSYFETPLMYGKPLEKIDPVKFTYIYDKQEP